MIFVRNCASCRGFGLLNSTGLFFKPRAILTSILKNSPTDLNNNPIGTLGMLRMGYESILMILLKPALFFGYHTFLMKFIVLCVGWPKEEGCVSVGQEKNRFQRSLAAKYWICLLLAFADRWWRPNAKLWYPGAEIPRMDTFLAEI